MTSNIEPSAHIRFVIYILRLDAGWDLNLQQDGLLYGVSYRLRRSIIICNMSKALTISHSSVFAHCSHRRNIF